jgi:hypothetical protein
MKSFDRQKFAASAKKLRDRFGPTRRFTEELARLVFRYLGPRGLRFDQVAFRVHDPLPDIVRVEMFVLGGGLMTIIIAMAEGSVAFGTDHSCADAPPPWATAGDRFTGPH